MKLSGAGIIWICLTFTGMKMSALLKRRVSLLEETLSFLVNLKIELLYRCDTVQNILIKLSAISLCSNLDYISFCCDELRNGNDFPSSWKKALNKSNLPYNREEKAKLVSLSDFLGTTDIDSQNTMLTLYKEYFNAFYEKALQKEKKYSRLYSTAGFVSGLGVFIMVM